jgi:phospholipase/carboxylesterase
VEAKTVGPLRARIARNASKSEGMTVVLLHGFGAPGDDLAGLANALAVPAGTTLVFPEALHDLGELAGPLYAGARAWWLIDFAKLEVAINTGAIEDLPNEIPEGLSEARASIVDFLDALEKQEGISLDRLVLGGFSQGAMLSMDVALHSERKMDGLVLLSGSYIAEREWKPRMPRRKGTSVFQSHGTEDPILPFQIAERLRGELAEAGLDVAFERFEGGHGIPASTMKRLGGWLEARAAAR